MADAFPTSPRAPGVVRASAFAWALAVALLATRTTITSSEWVGRPFPGFMLLDNRVIASIGLPGWSGASVSDLYQAQVVNRGRAIGSIGIRGLCLGRLPPRRHTGTVWAAA